MLSVFSCHQGVECNCEEYFSLTEFVISSDDDMRKVFGDTKDMVIPLLVDLNCLFLINFEN